MYIRSSICIATWNGEKHIHQQLKSIIEQLGTNDEVIISDDGSTDKTLEIIRSFNDPRIKIIFNKDKKGPLNNFQNALINSKGEFLFLADQDDTWLPKKLETHIKHLSYYDLVMSDAKVVDNNGNIIYNSFFDERGSKKGFINNLKRNSYIGCCMSFNRKILNLSLPFPKDIHMHDWWIGLVAELKGEVFFINQPFLNYTRHGNNASPTLENSNYSIFKRFKNRYHLAKSLLTIIFK